MVCVGDSDLSAAQVSPQAVVEQLAEHHPAHLRWLGARLQGLLAPDEFEDVLQTAYARALSSLSDRGSERLEFTGPAQAAAWLRAIALNHAYDLARQRHGRPAAGRAARPAPLSLDHAACGELVAGIDVEEEVLGAAGRESDRALVREAVTRLDPRHRQILQLRYGRGLAPAAVMVLVGIDRRQWEGRHTRALKAFGRALARLQPGRECRQTRIRLREAPESILHAGGGTATDHFASCVACAAFSRMAHFALAGLPLPLPIESWRLDAVEVLARPWSSAPPPPGDPAATGGAASTLVGMAGALVAAGILAVGALAVGGHPDAAHDRAAAVADGEASAASTTHTGTRLADHGTSRDALERSAREMGRRRLEEARDERRRNGALPRHPTP